MLRLYLPDHLEFQRCYGDNEDVERRLELKLIEDFRDSPELTVQGTLELAAKGEFVAGAQAFVGGKD